MDPNKKSQQLKKYFHVLKFKTLLLAVGISLFAFYTANDAGTTEMKNILMMVGLIFAGIIIYQLFRYFSSPPDEMVDEWLENDIRVIVEGSRRKLGMEGMRSMSEPLVIISPIYWRVPGIDIKDLALHKGKDGILRFSVYQLTIFHLHENILGSYVCHYDFVKNISVNESTCEYHYKDIVSVSTQEISSSYHMPNGVKLVHAQEFRLSVTSGDNIKVIVAANTIAKGLNAQLPPTGAEEAVSMIRGMLRTKKV